MRWRTTSAVVALGGAGLLGLTACGTGGGQPERKIAVEATDTECKVESTSSPTGSVTFEITNKGDRVTEFYLYGDNDRVISEVENIGPGLTRTMTANVAQAGKYTTACKPGMRGDGIRGAFTVTKGGGPTRPAIPQGVVSQYTVLGQEIRDAGGETTSGPWRIGYIVEAAEPWFHSANGQQHHREPAPGETHHIEIIPIEAETGRIVPDVPIGSRWWTARARSSTPGG